MDVPKEINLDYFEKEEPIKDLFYKYFINFIAFYESLYNIVRWMPIIWKDHDWDHAYFYTIIAFKLKNMEQYFRDNPVCVRDDIHSLRMKLCREALERLSEDNYIDYSKLRGASQFKKALEYQKEEDLKVWDLQYFADMFVLHSREWWN